MKINGRHPSIILLFICLLGVMVLSVGCQQVDLSEDKAYRDKKGGFTENESFETLTINTMDGATIKSEAVAKEAPAEVIVQNPNGNIHGHKLIAENSNYELYFLEESLSIIIRDKETGVIMESIVNEDDGKSNVAWQSYMKSGIVLRVLKGINIVPTTVDIRGAKKEVTLKDNGFTADVYYDEYQLGYQLNVTLDEQGLVVEIPNDSIVEASEEYKIGEIYVYPFLGYTYLGERTGYMMIPDGNGALIYLEDNEGRFSSCFSQYIYPEFDTYNLKKLKKPL